MAFQAKLSEQAAIDLDDIIRYICEDLLNPQSAENFFKAVNEKLELISEHPYIYPLHHDERLRSEGYRFVAIGNYLIFYLVDDERSIVNVARILYGRRDLQTAFIE